MDLLVRAHEYASAPETSQNCTIDDFVQRSPLLSTLPRRKQYEVVADAFFDDADDVAAVLDAADYDVQCGASALRSEAIDYYSAADASVAKRRRCAAPIIKFRPKQPCHLLPEVMHRQRTRLQWAEILNVREEIVEDYSSLDEAKQIRKERFLKSRVTLEEFTKEYLSKHKILTNTQVRFWKDWYDVYVPNLPVTAREFFTIIGADAIFLPTPLSATAAGRERERGEERERESEPEPEPETAASPAAAPATAPAAAGGPVPEPEPEPDTDAAAALRNVDAKMTQLDLDYDDMRPFKFWLNVFSHFGTLVPLAENRREYKCSVSVLQDAFYIRRVPQSWETPRPSNNIPLTFPSNVFQRFLHLQYPATHYHKSAEYETVARLLSERETIDNRVSELERNLLACREAWAFEMPTKRLDIGGTDLEERTAFKEWYTFNQLIFGPSALAELRRLVYERPPAPASLTETQRKGKLLSAMNYFHEWATRLTPYSTVANSTPESYYDIYAPSECRDFIRYPNTYRYKILFALERLGLGDQLPGQIVSEHGVDAADVGTDARGAPVPDLPDESRAATVLYLQNITEETRRKIKTADEKYLQFPKLSQQKLAFLKEFEREGDQPSRASDASWPSQDLRRRSNDLFGVDMTLWTDATHLARLQRAVRWFLDTTRFPNEEELNTMYFFSYAEPARQPRRRLLLDDLQQLMQQFNVQYSRRPAFRRLRADLVDTVVNEVESELTPDVKFMRGLSEFIRERKSEYETWFLNATKFLVAVQAPAVCVQNVRYAYDAFQLLKQDTDDWNVSMRKLRGYGDEHKTWVHWDAYDKKALASVLKNINSQTQAQLDKFMASVINYFKTISSLDEGSPLALQDRADEAACSVPVYDKTLGENDMRTTSYSLYADDGLLAFQVDTTQDEKPKVEQIVRYSSADVVRFMCDKFFTVPYNDIYFRNGFKQACRLKQTVYLDFACRNISSVFRMGKTFSRKLTLALIELDVRNPNSDYKFSSARMQTFCRDLKEQGIGATRRDAVEEQLEYAFYLPTGDDALVWVAGVIRNAWPAKETESEIFAGATDLVRV